MGKGDKRASRGFVKKAIRSGVRRYPGAVGRSLRAGKIKTGAADPAACLRAIVDHELAASWLGHASVLLRQGGMSSAADPVFSERIGGRVGPVSVGPERIMPVPVDPERLPEIDLILISHAHFDHLDRPTLKSLASGRTSVVTARKTRRLIPRGFRRVIELDWGESVEIDTVRIEAVEPAHWGARVGLDRRRGCNSYLVHADGATSLLAGDTAHTERFAELPPVDLAALGIGAYDPWEHHHATPEQVWSMFTGFGGKRLLPIHHSTFELSDEPIHEPMDRLIEAAGDEAHRVIRVGPGQVWTPELEAALREA